MARTSVASAMCPRRVLLAPWSLGAGHTGRCLVVARALSQAGYECVFLDDPTQGFVSAEGFPVVGQPGARRPRVIIPSRGYMPVSSLDDAYAAAGYYHAGRIAAQLELDQQTIRSTGASLLVTDMQPTAVIAARLSGLPVLSLADGDFLRRGKNTWMFWLPEHVTLSPFPPSLPAFNRVLEDVGLPPLRDVSEILQTEQVLVASAPDLDPISGLDTTDAITYVGPLLWDPHDRDCGDALEGFGDSGAPRIYVSVGSGELSAGGLAQAAAEVAASEGWNVLFATGYGARMPVEMKLPPTMTIARFGGIRAAIRWADAVICHGGHSTIHASLLGAKPSEMEGNGRLMVERTGTGFLLWHSEWDEQSDKLRFVRRYGQASDGMQIDSQDLLACIRELLAEPAYERRATQIAERMRPLTATAADMIIDHARNLME